jgi:glycosyltransferase involved in cell wall biosynthesis
MNQATVDLSGEAVEPVVTIVIVTYNVGKFVAESLQSALNQSFSDFELILADDGSTDDTVEIARSFRDPRISVLACPHRGPTWVLNEGFARARGRYVALLDGDDLWAPDRLRHHVEYMESQPDVDLTFSLARTIEEDGTDTGFISRQWSGPVPFSFFLTENLAGASAVTVRRSAAVQAGQFDTKMEAAYDYDLWLRIAVLREGNIHCIPEPLSCYRRRCGQLTKDWRLMERSGLYLADKFRMLRPAEMRRADPRRLLNLYRCLAMIAYEGGAYRDGAKLLWRSLAASPIGFFTTPSCYRAILAIAAGLVLPVPWVRPLEGLASRLARLRRKAAPARLTRGSQRLFPPV